jgi:Trehalase
MELSPDGRERLIAGAKAVLEGNRAGHSTKPSPDLYPHQWMWDSCFIAIGVSRYDPERAQNELRALLRGQWSNGMVPQIIFNPESTGYFPGPETWLSHQSPYAPRDVQTSGITQPPVLATAALAAYKNDPDPGRAEAFAREVYPKILAYHEFLYRERNPDGSGLIVVVHPWESGLDNSPPYLDAGSRVDLTYKPKYTRLDTKHVSAEHRPSDKDYDLFVWLLEQMRRVNYDWNGYLPQAALQVEDVLFNSILVRANDDLFELGEAIGAAQYESDYRAISPFERHGTAEAIDSKLWDDESGMYFSYDRVAGRLLREQTVSSFMPKLSHRSGIHVRERVARLTTCLEDPARFAPKAGYVCPTTALDSKWFNPENYWLGPVWVNTNWLLIQAFGDRVPRIRSDTIDLIQKSGFREYFNPFTGEGYGTDRFSWSAALTIDLLSDESPR